MQKLFLVLSLLVSLAWTQGLSDEIPPPAPAAYPPAAETPEYDLSATPEPAPVAAAPSVVAAIVDNEMEGMSDWVSDESADEKLLELMAQGKYVRKSIMVLPALFWVGEGRNRLTNRQVNLIIESLRDSLSNMSRFDINPVPDRANRNLFRRWNQEFNRDWTQSRKIEKLGELITETLTPDLLGFMASAMQERAEKNLTEDQLNSFMVDKAKESGVTAAELNLVLNSGYVAVPTMSYKAYGYDQDGQINATLQGGLILYKVRVSKEKAWLEKYATIMRVGQHIQKDQFTLSELMSFPNDWRGLSREGITFNIAVRDFSSAVAQDVRDQKDFRLLTQMTWAEGSKYHLPFGAGEIKEVPIDKFFENVEMVENDKGEVEEKVTGWGFVYKPDNFKYPVRKLDENIAEYTWQAYAPKGSPMAGSVAREYSRVPVDVDIRMGLAMMSIEVPAGGMTAGGTPLFGIIHNGYIYDQDETIAGNGPFVGLQTSISSLFGVSQLALRVNTNFSTLSINTDEIKMVFVTVNGAVPVESFQTVDVGLGLQKKWWFGRVVPALGLDARFGMLFLANSLSDISLNTYTVGARGTGAVEFAFTPNFRVGAYAAALYTATLPVWTYTQGELEESVVLDANSGNVQLSPLTYEIGVQIMINAWPLRKFWDSIMATTTTGVVGMARNVSLRPIDY